MADEHLAGSDVRSSLEALTQRVAHIEQYMELWSRTLGVPYSSQSPGGVPADVVELARAGKTIEAIKRYRELTNASLEEAKSVVDGLE